MKLTIEIDCSPEEAREMLGLPDVKALQDQWLEKTGIALMADSKLFSPETLVANWTKASAPGFDAMPAMFQSLITSAMSNKK